MATNYKEWIARYDNNTKTKIQCWKKRIGTAESKLKLASLGPLFYLDQVLRSETFTCLKDTLRSSFFYVPIHGKAY
ncbi:hypothetical protein WN944_011025 [Citrus x changshan-huyou]|uniref:Uncharacterized protein n=1 Tax=Citrus x changshan-huyou TaxID=2935761 RepID=A0AAP0MW60_9ROSI